MLRFHPYNSINIKESIKMKFRLFSLMLASLSLVVILGACSSTDYYRDRAVQRARTFLLEEDRSLNLEQREYVKFNKPVIMAESIFSNIGTDSASDGPLSHVCIAWVVPGKKDAYVVFGVSDNRLKNWSPNRLITKRYDIPIYSYQAASMTAVAYAANNFLYLSPETLNKIRFEIPETIVTDYKFGKETLEAKKISKANLKSLVQTTFVWNSTRPGHKLFVCGLGAKDLARWRPIFGGETSTTELKSHFLQTVSFGQFDEIDKIAKAAAAKAAAAKAKKDKK